MLRYAEGRQNDKRGIYPVDAGRPRGGEDADMEKRRERRGETAMNMTREELRQWFAEWLDDYYDELHSEDELTPEVAESVLSALRPVSREQVAKVWMGEWIVGEPNGLGFPIHCSRCGWGTDHADPRKWMDYGGHIFCGHCGAPMTDEAVQMVMERLEALNENIHNG